MDYFVLLTPDVVFGKKIVSMVAGTCLLFLNSFLFFPLEPPGFGVLRKKNIDTKLQAYSKQLS